MRRRKADMVWMILSFISVCLFCLSSHGLMRAVARPIDLSRRGEFSYRALRIERSYKVFAWAMLSLFLFVSMIQSFIQSFLSL